MESTMYCVSNVYFFLLAHFGIVCYNDVMVMYILNEYFFEERVLKFILYTVIKVGKMRKIKISGNCSSPNIPNQENHKLV